MAAGTEEDVLEDEETGNSDNDVDEDEGGTENVCSGHASCSYY
jgi:hypothetical protein